MVRSKLTQHPDQDSSLEPIPDAARQQYLSLIRATIAGRKYAQYFWPALIVSMLSPSKGIPALRLLARDRRRLKNALRFAERAVPVLAFVANVREYMRRPGDEVGSPAIVLVSFEKEQPGKPWFEVLVPLAMAEAANAPDPEGRRAFFKELAGPYKFTENRRRSLPTSVTRDRKIFVCDAMIQRALLAGGSISSAFAMVPFMAEPGDNGRIAQLPWWCFKAQPSPTPEAQKQFVGSLDFLNHNCDRK